MVLFSRRFWNTVIAHDRRLASAANDYDVAVRRLRASSACVTQQAQTEFLMEFCEAIRELRGALSELREFQRRHTA